MTPIIEEDILFCNPDIFGDEEEHYYRVECYDGKAVATKCDDEDNIPTTLHLSYPTLEEVLADEELADEVRAYRGLPLSETIHYGDIMMALGEPHTC